MDRRKTFRNAYRIATIVTLVTPSVGLAESTNEATLPETVVTATRVETPIDEVGRVVESRSRDEFQEQEASNLADALQSVSGLRISEVGGPGSPGVTPVEIRGFRSGGTQFLINGLRYNDPSSVSGTLQAFAPYLIVEDLQSVEVLKGASSVLYGSDGQAGAINLRTISPEPGAWGEASIQGGSFGTTQESVTFNLANETSGINGVVTRTDSDGIDTHGNYENTTAATNAVVALTDTVRIEPVIRFVRAKQNLDTGPSLDLNGAFVPSQDKARDNVDAQHIFAALSGVYEDSSLESRLSAYVNDSRRDYMFEFGGFESPFRYEGQSTNLDWQNAIPFEELNSELIAGLDFEHQLSDADSPGLSDEGKQDRYGAFAKLRNTLFDDLLHTDAGVRVSHISSIGKTLPTLEASTLLNVPATPLQLHASVAQGFRAPTLYETDGLAVDYMTNEIVNVGNDDLDAEESLTFDFGTRVALNDRSHIDMTAFHIASDQTILFDFENLTHRNGGPAETHGLENSFSYEPCEWMTLRAAHTYIGKADGLDHDRLQPRPYNTATASSTIRYLDFILFTEVRFRGDQELAFFGTDFRHTEGDYTLVNAAISYALTSNAELFVRANNILDRNFTEYGYEMPGVGVWGGFRVRLGQTDQ